MFLYNTRELCMYVYTHEIRESEAHTMCYKNTFKERSKIRQRTEKLKMMKNKTKTGKNNFYRCCYYRRYIFTVIMDVIFLVVLVHT